MKQRVTVRVHAILVFGERVFHDRVSTAPLVTRLRKMPRSMHVGIAKGYQSSRHSEIAVSETSYGGLLSALTSGIVAVWKKPCNTY